MKIGIWRNTRLALLVVVLRSMSGCLSSIRVGAVDDGAAGSDGTGLNGMGDPNTLVGTFQVKVTPETTRAAAATIVFGKVYDGATPSTIVWENPQVDGDCTLTTPRVPYCSTPCGGTAACVEENTCLDYPATRGVGVVKVDGLRTVSGATSFDMKPVANAYQPPAGTTLEYPPFDEGDSVTFTAAGDYFAGFSLKSSGITPLVLVSTSLTLQPDSPITLKWEPGSSSTASVQVKLDISHHGGTKGQILCDTADSGELIISAALVTQLIDLGVAGYPSIIVTRHASGSAVIAAGRVDLDVSSTVEQSVDVEGLVSCADDGDCPTGQACQSDLTCS